MNQDIKQEWIKLLSEYCNSANQMYEMINIPSIDKFLYNIDFISELIYHKKVDRKTIIHFRYVAMLYLEEYTQYKLKK